ncbi:hypothetical protein [Pedobacter sp. SYP-B3415]|uniref:hypothetical protein n=1 Tax=Pedobacter sp. SYP-B3415 TaxID=2496641 RepID=UPI00101D8A1C|nr:hypothetical protein [Pedobacter sp. SYP-B3415]
MTKLPFCIFYQVFLNDTAVSRISSNDFKQSVAFSNKISVPGPHKDALGRCTAYSLPPAANMYYGYPTQVEAMEMAKAGALRHIDKLTAIAESGINALKAYRMEHYTDLNVTLVDANIRRLEKQLNIK